MTAAYEEVPFSDLLHRPAATAGRLDSIRALRLRRRGTGDLALMRVEQLEQDGSVVDFTAKLLSSFAAREGADGLRRILPEALPWMTFLPEPDAEEFLGELVDVARGAAALDNLTPLAVLLTQWKHTAEVHADPALRALVEREPEGDFGAAAPPAEGDA